VSDSVESTVIAYFKEKGELPVQKTDEILAFTYVPGFLDSFGTIEFVIWLEETFKVHFSQEQLQSEAFRTIGGVVGIVGELQRAGDLGEPAR
jgi:acyl carrier protein